MEQRGLENFGIEREKVEVEHWMMGEEAREYRTKLHELEEKLNLKDRGLEVYSVIDMKKFSEGKSPEFFVLLVECLKLHLEFYSKLRYNGGLKEYIPDKKDVCALKIYKMLKWTEDSALVKGQIHNHSLSGNSFLKSINEIDGVPTMEYLRKQKEEDNRKDREKMDSIKGLEGDGYFFNDFERGRLYTFWTHMDKSDTSYIDLIECVLWYDGYLPYGVVLYDEEGEHTDTYMITKEFGEHLIKTYFMKEVDGGIKKWLNPKFKKKEKFEKNKIESKIEKMSEEFKGLLKEKYGFEVEIIIKKK